MVYTTLIPVICSSGNVNAFPSSTAAAALALGISFGVGGGQHQRHRAAHQSALQHKLDSLVLGGVYDWDAWAKQVAADLK